MAIAKRRTFNLEDVDQDLFWAKKRVLPNGCWEWTAHKYEKGYGQFRLRTSAGRKQARAHRVAYFLKTGEHPECVCHTCDFPPCINPDHLFAGDHKTNAADMVRKGRDGYARGKWVPPRFYGEDHPHAKINKKDSKIIKSLHYKVTVEKIAARFGVSKSVIEKVLDGTHWTVRE